MDRDEDARDTNVGPSKKRAKLESSRKEELDVDSGDEYDDIDYGEDDDGTGQEQAQDKVPEKKLEEVKDLRAILDDDEISSHSGSLDDEEQAIEENEDTEQSSNKQTKELSNQDEDGADKSNQKPTAERCKFWPTCNAGTKCAYYHPTKPCKTFPNCRFGNNCLYMHPPCKFNPNCAKPNCPFAHPISQSHNRRPPYFRAIQQPPVMPMRCKYGSNCTNQMCKFYHPKQEACKFGANCLLESCTFTHPQDRKKTSAFKWTAQS